MGKCSQCAVKSKVMKCFDEQEYEVKDSKQGGWHKKWRRRRKGGRTEEKDALEEGEKRHREGDEAGVRAIVRANTAH